MYRDGIGNYYLAQHIRGINRSLLAAGRFHGHRRFPNGNFGLPRTALCFLHGNKGHRKPGRFTFKNRYIRNIKGIKTCRLSQYIIACIRGAGKVWICGKIPADRF